MSLNRSNKRNKERRKLIAFFWTQSPSYYLWNKVRKWKASNIIAVVKCNRLRWAGHLVRMDPNRAPRKLFENDPDGC